MAVKFISESLTSIQLNSISVSDMINEQRPTQNIGDQDKGKEAAYKKMQMGQVIRKYRKIKNMTQEEMASRLGVSAPAVNKWENGNSFPDIMLLAPIARLLNITPDTLLEFREEMTEEEIGEIVRETDKRMREGTYEETFQWVKRKVEEYPDCQRLMVQMAVVLDANGVLKGIHEKQYEDVILWWYQRALESKDEDIRIMAADGLFGFYKRKGQYDKAEKCVGFFSDQNPEKKWRLAEIYRETGKTEEAYKAYEELLFSSYRRVSVYFYGIFRLAIDSGNMEKAHMAARKMGDLAKVFEMGEYYQVSGSLELAAMEKDADAAINIMEKMILNADSLCIWMESDLYQHMAFKNVNPEFFRNLKDNLIKLFHDEDSFGFLKEDARWKKLVGMKNG